MKIIFQNENISTEFHLVTAQSTAYEPAEDIEDLNKHIIEEAERKKDSILTCIPDGH
jgi:cell division protein FtsL